MLTRLVIQGLVPLLLFFVFGSPARASLPVEAMNKEMEKYIAPLQKGEGWKDFVKAHPDLFVEVSAEKPASFVGVSDYTTTIDNKEYKIGVGTRTVFINATVKNVLAVSDAPKFFQSLYGLDKSAEMDPPEPDGSFKAHIFKLIPGIETQDSTLSYSGHWSGDAWIGQARMVKDEREFALRNNIKITEPQGQGSVFREVALFVPQRWWMNLFHGTVQSITKRELTKLNVSLKCAAEKIQNSGAPMSDEIAKTCYKEATK